MNFRFSQMAAMKQRVNILKGSEYFQAVRGNIKWCCGPGSTPGPCVWHLCSIASEWSSDSGRFSPPTYFHTSFLDSWEEATKGILNQNCQNKKRAENVTLKQPQLIWCGCHRSSVKGQRAQSNRGPAESSQPGRTGQNKKKRTEREFPFWSVLRKGPLLTGGRRKRMSSWRKSKH